MKPIGLPWPGGAFLRALFAALAMTVAASAPVRAAPAAAETDPSAATSQFYSWYLAALVANRDPLHDDPSGLSARVSAALIREIRIKLASPNGMEADYFIQAQDYADDWIGHIAVAPARGNAGAKVVFVVLGAQPSTRQRLTVVLAKEGGAWKIRKVSAR